MFQNTAAILQTHRSGARPRQTPLPPLAPPPPPPVLCQRRRSSGSCSRSQLRGERRFPMIVVGRSITCLFSVSNKKTGSFRIMHLKKKGWGGDCWWGWCCYSTRGFYIYLIVAHYSAVMCFSLPYCDRVTVPCPSVFHNATPGRANSKSFYQHDTYTLLRPISFGTEYITK